jgi:hypothetical protein
MKNRGVLASVFVRLFLCACQNFVLHEKAHVQKKCG